MVTEQNSEAEAEEIDPNCIEGIVNTIEYWAFKTETNFIWHLNCGWILADQHFVEQCIL